MSAAKVAAALIAAEKNNPTQPAAIPVQGFMQRKQKNNTKGKKHRDTHRTITIRNPGWIHRILAYWGGI